MLPRETVSKKSIKPNQIWAGDGNKEAEVPLRDQGQGQQREEGKVRTEQDKTMEFQFCRKIKPSEQKRKRDAPRRSKLEASVTSRGLGKGFFKEEKMTGVKILISIKRER